MTWSGNTKTREAGRQHHRRQRFNSNSSRGSPSPKLLEDRSSPVQSSDKPALRVRITPPPLQLQSSMPRSPSPSGNAYAGPKFSDPPSPDLLPKPPSHWTSFCGSVEAGSCSDMSSQLKMLLKVAAQPV